MYDVLRFVVGIRTSSITFDIKFTLIIFIGILDLYHLFGSSIQGRENLNIDLDISLALNFRKIKN